jgi:UDP-N-acetyl-D-glucosamine dehydrogenase
MTAPRQDPGRLQGAFADGTARIGIIGMGYVGLPLMLAAIKAGFHVTGFDIDGERVAALNAGRSPLQHIGHDRIAAARTAIQFEATTAFGRLAEMDAILICVPTPLGPHREPDLSFVETTAREVAARLRPGQLVVLESTTYPGTTRDVLKPILEGSGLRSGRNFWLAYSPEREDPGNLDFETARIPKLVGGDGTVARDLAQALYDRLVIRTVPVSSPETAEAAKLTENIFRAVNIALVNELKLVFTEMGIDVFEVIEAASTKPFGYMPFWPGPGLGGHCIPIDPFYLTWKAHEVGQRTRFIELAGEINRSMPAHVVRRLGELIDQESGKGLSVARVLVIGLAYKKNVDDIRESPALEIIDLLEAKGASVTYHDPHVVEIPRTRAHGRLAGRQSVPLSDERLAEVDAVLIVTDHDAIDWRRITARARLVVDTRNVARRHPGAALVVAA